MLDMKLSESFLRKAAAEGVEPIAVGGLVPEAAPPVEPAQVESGDIDTTEKRLRNEIERLKGLLEQYQKTNFSQAAKINSISGARAEFADKLLNVLGYTKYTEEYENANIVDEVTQLKEREGRLKGFVVLCEEKLDQRLQGQYTNEQVLGMLLKEARNLMLMYSIKAAVTGE